MIKTIINFVIILLLFILVSSPFIDINKIYIGIITSIVILLFILNTYIIKTNSNYRKIIRYGNPRYNSPYKNIVTSNTLSTPSSSPLPVLIINTNGWDPMVLHDKQPVTLTVTDNNLTPMPSNIATMWVRGQSSSNFAKRQWTVKFEDKVSLMGLHKSKKYVLQGPWVDKSLVRNKLMFDLGREMGTWSPSSKFCEVLLNKSGGAGDTARDYWGVYLVTESTKVKSYKVDIDTANGDYLFSFDKIAEGDVFFELPRVNENDVAITGLDIVLTDPEEIADIPGLKQIINNFQSMLFSEDFADNYQDYIDVDSFVDFFILTELSDDTDAYKWSTNFYTKNGIIYAGPLWDFNMALGQSHFEPEGGWRYLISSKTSQDSIYYSSTGEWRQIKIGSASWIYRLLQIEGFVYKIKLRLTNLMNGGLLSENSLLNRFKTYSTALGQKYNLNTMGGTPESRNFSKWDVLSWDKFDFGNWAIPALVPTPKCFMGNTDFITCDGTNNTDLSNLSALGRVYIFCIRRLKWMESNLGLRAKCESDCRSNCTGCGNQAKCWKECLAPCMPSCNQLL